MKNDVKNLILEYGFEYEEIDFIAYNFNNSNFCIIPVKCSRETFDNDPRNLYFKTIDELEVFLKNLSKETCKSILVQYF